LFSTWFTARDAGRGFQVEIGPDYTALHTCGLKNIRRLSNMSQVPKQLSPIQTTSDRIGVAI